MIPVIAIFLILTFQVTRSYAQGQTPSESVATPISSPTPSATPSDTEIKKTLVRSLDKIEENQNVDKAKDDVIAKQDELIRKLEDVNALANKETLSLRDALTKQTEAKDAALFGWNADEKRVKQLESKLRKSDNRLKWMAAGGIITVVATILLKR